MRVHSVPSLFIGVAATVAVAGCTGAQNAPQQQMGQAAPDFTVQTLQPNGGQVSLASLRGKVVVLDIWASWCAPCAQELPKLADLYNAEHANGLEVVAVSQDSDPADAQRFLQEHPLPFTIASDPQNSVAGAYNPSNMPSSYVISKDGQIVYVNAGYHDGDDQKIATAVKQALGG
jgi:peroxiredoxin